MKNNHRPPPLNFYKSARSIIAAFVDCRQRNLSHGMNFLLKVLRGKLLQTTFPLKSYGHFVFGKSLRTLAHLENGVIHQKCMKLQETTMRKGAQGISKPKGF